ncbi:T9SS type A sorting domain-containing protein [Xanthomarina sp. GH4-25]|uniref:T9SS type A sorting domain-containing protein n=1 Tax=Xanthomarina sp. GH4-25 TaxID=3349335 RepID=UPI003877BC70
MKKITFLLFAMVAFTWQANAQNSTCATAAPLTIGGTACAGTSGGANSGDPTGNDDTDGNVCSSSYSGGDDFIFEYTATTTDALKLDLFATNTWTGIMVTEGCPTTGTCFASATSSSINESLTTPAMTIGATYYIHVSTYPSPQSPGQFCIDATLETPATPPANDDCSGAIGLTVNADYACGTVTAGTTVGATASSQADDVTGTPNNDVWYSFVATSTDHRISLLNIVNEAGGDTSVDMGIGVYDATGGCAGLVFFDDSDPETLDLTGLSVGVEYYVRVYGWYSALSYNSFDVCVGTPVCTAATATIPADPIDNANCPTTVDVSISIDDLGDSGTLTIYAEDDLGNPAGTGGTVSATGIFTITDVPVPQTSWTIFIAHESNATCDTELGPFFLNCPPANDDACNAEALTMDAAPVTGNNGYSTFEANEVPGSCFTSTANSNSVWYSFVAPASGEVQISTDFVTPLDDTQIALYSITDCNDLLTATQISCDEDGGTTGSGWNSIINTTDDATPLTPGSMYYIQVDAYGNKAGEFNIEVITLAPLSTTDFNIDSAFTYYPNPVNNSLTLNAQKDIQNVAVYNMLGQEVLRTAPNTVNSEVDMSNLQPGAYFVKVTVENATKTIKVIKK